MNNMKVDWFIYKVILIQKISSVLGVKCHVYKSMSGIKTIDTDNVESPNDAKQYTSIPERQIGD